MTSGAPTAALGTDALEVGHAPRRASSRYDHRTTGSLSPLSSVSHPIPARSAAAACHEASRLVLPKPAGQATSVRPRA